MFDLTGKTAVVTGGSRGIGRAICLKLAGQGANIVLNFAGNEAAAEETRSQCEALGVPGHCGKGRCSRGRGLQCPHRPGSQGVWRHGHSGVQCRCHPG